MSGGGILLNKQTKFFLSISTFKAVQLLFKKLFSIVFFILPTIFVREKRYRFSLKGYFIP